MKIYIVTETAAENNTLLRSWVCFTHEQAVECLNKRYDIACSYSVIGGMEIPTDTRECGFFYWTLSNGQRNRYNIVESNTFAE